MSYEQNEALTAPISTLPTVTLDQWLSKLETWKESTDILVRLWFVNQLGTRAELGRHLGMAKSTITYHCNKLIEAGCSEIPSSKGQGKRRDLEQVEPVQEVEVIDVSSNVELPLEPSNSMPQHIWRGLALTGKTVKDRERQKEAFFDQMLEKSDREIKSLREMKPAASGLLDELRLTAEKERDEALAENKKLKRQVVSVEYSADYAGFDDPQLYEICRKAYALNEAIPAFVEGFESHSGSDLKQVHDLLMQLAETIADRL